MFANPFAPRPRRADPEAERLKSLVRTVLAVPDDTAVTVSEIACRDAACGGVETAVLLLAPRRRTRAYRLPGPMTVQTAESLRAARPVDGDDDAWARPR